MHYFLVIFQYTLSPKTKRAIFTTEWFQMINCFMLFQSLLVIEVFTTVTTHIFLKQDKRNQACKGMASPSKQNRTDPFWLIPAVIMVIGN